MSPIRITGSAPRDLDGRELRTLYTGPSDAAASMSYCSAPWRTLLVDQGGAVATCRAAAMPIAKRANADIAQAFAAPTLGALRAVLAAGQLDGEHCAACVHSIELGIAEQSSMVRDHVALAPVPDAPEYPPRLVVRLGPASEPASGASSAARSHRASAERLLARIVPSLPRLAEIELEADDVLGHELTFEICAAIAALEPERRPALHLRTARAPAGSAAGDSSLPIAPRRICLTDGAQLESSLPWARRVLEAHDDARIEVRVLLDGGNWFDLGRFAALCSTFDAHFDVRVADEAGHIPLLDLPLVEQRAIESFLGSAIGRIDAVPDLRSVSGSDHDRLLRGVQRAIEARTAALQFADPQRALRGGGTHIELPDATGPAFAEPAMGGGLLRSLAALEDSRAIVEWAERQVVAPEFREFAESRPWLRLLVQKAAFDGAGETVLEFLRAIYRRANSRKQLRAAERALGGSLGLEWAVAMWGERLGIDRYTRRTAPSFVASPSESQTLSGDDVTVLVPSYAHERYVADCVRSARAQSLPEVRVLVADDRSPDRTVERVRRLRDPHVQVVVNERNLGLGNSVLQALETIDTPYVALLNSDDLFHPDRIEVCRRVLEDDPSAQLVATGLVLIDKRGGEITPANVSRLRDGDNICDWVRWYESARPETMDPEELFGELLQHNFLATSSNIVCRTEFLRAEAEALRSLEYSLDWHLFLSAALARGLRYVPDRLAAYRLHPSNTVWFRDGKRWSYFLEVNRVASTALRRFHDLTAERESQDAARAATLRLVAERLSQNGDTAGFGLFVCELLGGRELDALSEGDETTRASVQDLYRLASRANQLRYATGAIADADLQTWLQRASGQAPLLVARVLADIRAEQIGFWRGTAEWNKRRVADLEASMAAANQATRAMVREVAQFSNGQLPARPDAPSPASQSPIERIQYEVMRIRDGFAALQNNRDELRQRATRLDGELAAAAKIAEQERQRARTALEAVEQRLREESELRLASEQREASVRAAADRRDVELQAEIRAVQDAAAAAAAAAEAADAAASAHAESLNRRIEELAATLASTQQALAELEQRRAALRAELDATIVTLRDARAGWQASETARLAAEALAETRRIEIARLTEERDRVLHSREYRIGYALWRKLPFFAKSRRLLRRSYHGLREGSTRLLWSSRRSLRERFARGGSLRIAACSTAQFPVMWHTFVYQELTSMHEMLGAEVRLFHTQRGRDEDLHAAFRYIGEHSVYVPIHRETHEADYRHFLVTRRERVESLLAALEQESGIPRAELVERGDVLFAFTYARRMEAWGADYVHTYFFYEQALCGLVAHWMLGIPRGVSAYADHMMQDWPLKVVPLHLRTADVIVATSRRIRDELVGIGGEAIAERVLVKPNGVDGSRFPATGPRAAPSGANKRLELVCVARIEPKKGFVELAEAAALLRERGRDVHFHVIGSIDPLSPGSVEYGARLDARIAELDVAASFTFHGAMRQEALREHLARAHAFVAPFVETAAGDKDGIPTAILEAMAAGLALIGTDAGSIPEIFDDGVEGLLVKQRDPAALAAAIERLLAAPQSIVEMGVRARARFEREFDTRATEPALHARIRAAVAREPRA